MQITVDLAPDLQARLAAEAQAHGLAIENYIVEKLREVRAARDRKTASEAADAIREMRKHNTLGGIEIRELIEEGRKY